MKPQKLLMDVRPGDQPEGSYPYGKNGVQFDLYGSVINEPGFRLMAASVPYTLMGHISTDFKIILFSTNETDSAIGYFNPDTELYEPIVDDRTANLVNWPNGPKLGFKLNYYITGQAQRNYKGEVVVAFTDKNKFPKYLNCDNPAVTSLDDIRMFPVYVPPRFSLSEGTGGSLPPGTYYVVTSYEKTDGTTTPWSEVSEGITIKPGEISTISDKTLQIDITEADGRYQYIRLAIISKAGGKTTAVTLTDLIPVGDGTLQFSYTGDNITEAISVAELLTPPAVYDKVGTIGQLNDSLYIGDLETEPDINDMQQYASLVTVNFVSELIDATAPPPEHISGKKRGMMHEEVYALYIRYHKTRGGFTKAFTIPGTRPTSIDMAPSTEASVGGSTTSVNKFRVEDRIPSFNPTAKTGIPGPYMNDSEIYPDTIEFDSTTLGGDNLRNQSVLHHKMPSLRWCKANFYPSETAYGKTKLDLLGIKVANVTIPDRYLDILDGFEILFAKRTPANMTVFGQGIMLHTVQATQEASLAAKDANQYTTGGNYKAEVLHRSSGDYQDSHDLTHMSLECMRIHPFDMLLNKPSIAAAFVSAQFKLKKTNLQAEGYYEDGSDAGGSRNVPEVFLIDYTKSAINPAQVGSGRLLRHINKGFYLTNGISISKVINIRHEACWAAFLDGPNWPLATGISSWRAHSGDSHTEASRGIPDFEEGYLVNLIANKFNVYQNFYSQPLVSMGAYTLFDDPIPTLFGGDTFACDYTFHTYGRHAKDDEFGEGILGKKVIRRIVCESTANIALRYEIAGNEYSKWYPKNAISKDNPDNCYITRFDRSKEPNQVGYTKDLNALNDFVSSTIFSPYREEITQHPYRIHRGGKLSRQSKPRSWRSFLPLDFYEMQKNMGKIINICGQDDTLLIHCLNALFRTQDKAKLDAGLLSVTLGTGDIFQFEPQEANSAPLGYAGTQHDLACVQTPLGYLFADAKQGEFYLFKGQLQNLNAGVNTFLRQYLKVKENNPYTGNGITVGWDQKYKRVLLTVKNQLPASGTVKTFQNTNSFFDSLVVGDIVNYNGRYIRYDGVNDPEVSGIDCDADVAAPDQFAWVPLDFRCEQDVPIVPVATGTTFQNMSSPNFLFWDDIFEVMYAIDFDDTTSLFYSVNLSNGDRTYRGAVVNIGYSFSADLEFRRLYVTCRYGGLKTLDIATDAVIETNFGSDVDFSRQGAYICGDFIVSKDVVTNSMYFISRETLNLVFTRNISSDIPSGSTYLEGVFNILYINDQIWIFPYNSLNGKVAIYSSDMLTLIGTITLPGALAIDWSGDRYFQNISYDPLYGKVYVEEIGSSIMNTIDSTTLVVTQHTWILPEGISNVFMRILIDPVTGALYWVYLGRDSTSGTLTDIRTYVVDRITGTILHVYMDFEIENELVRQGMTDFMWVAKPMNKVWDGGAWATDGELIEYSHGDTP